MSEKITLTWGDIDKFKKFMRLFYNLGFNKGKKEIINKEDFKLVDWNDLHFANAEHVDPTTEEFLK